MMKRTQIIIACVCAATATLVAIGVVVGIRFWCPGSICVFTGSTNSTELSCQDRKLDAIPIGCLRSHSKVDILLLQRNKVSAIHKDDLKPLSSLRALDVSQNRVSYIEEGALDSLEDLEEFHLFENRLGVMPSLVHSPKVSSVFVYKNEIVHVPEVIFAPGVKVDLRMQENHFKTLAARTFLEVADGSQVAFDEGVTICARNEQELEELLGKYIRIWVRGTAIELKNVAGVC